MERSIKKNRRYLLWMVILCALIPHAVLILLELEYATDPMGTATQETFAKFFVCQWAPFCAAIIAYLRLQNRDNFSLLPALCFGLIVPTLLYRFDQISATFMKNGISENNANAIVFVIPMMLTMECSALLKMLESSNHKVVSGIAADRGILRAFLFWSVGIPCLAILSCEACAYYTRVILPWSLIPIPGILVYEVFRQQKNRLPTVWGAIGMLLMVPVSLILVTIGPMEMFKVYHFTIQLSGHLILALMLVVYNIDHWRKTKAGNELIQ